MDNSGKSWGDHGRIKCKLGKTKEDVGSVGSMGGMGSVGRHGRPREDMGNATGSPTINLVQNGLFLLSSHVHQKLDQYFISVNPDDGYKIVCV